MKFMFDGSQRSPRVNAVIILSVVLVVSFLLFRFYNLNYRLPTLLMEEISLASMGEGALSPHQYNWISLADEERQRALSSLTASLSGKGPKRAAEEAKLLLGDATSYLDDIDLFEQWLGVQLLSIETPKEAWIIDESVDEVISIQAGDTCLVLRQIRIYWKLSSLARCS